MLLSGCKDERYLLLDDEISYPEIFFSLVFFSS